VILLELLLGFLKVGCFAFGGAYAAIPLIREVVLSYGWLDDSAISYMIAVSESTPGPIMVNLATYIGSSQGGVLGALIATVASITPAFVIILLLMAALKHVLNNRHVQAALTGLGACVTGIIVAVGGWMLWENLVPSARVDIRAVGIAAILIGISAAWKPVFHKKLSPILLIAISAVLGIVFYL